MGEVLLDARNIKKYFPITKGFLLMRTVGNVKAVDNVSFSVIEGDTFGLVGESGCGKTTTLRLILLLEKLTSGSIFFRGKDINRLSAAELKWYRSSVQAMFQDPYGSLDPRMKVGNIIGEPITINLGLPPAAVKEMVGEILNEVGLSPASAANYPQEFSGGQRQRIALARAIAINPSLVILDEPVSALDVSVRAQLLNLLVDIQHRMGLTYIVIAHDLAVVRHVSTRMAVMYLGKIAEYGNSEGVYIERLHPYTKALLSAALPSHPDAVGSEIILPGEVPSPVNPPSGCYFHPRCLYAKEVCSQEEPLLESASSDHMVACHFWKDISG